MMGLQESICDGRVRDFIFTNINLAKTQVFLLSRLWKRFTFATPQRMNIWLEDLPASWQGSKV